MVGWRSPQRTVLTYWSQVFLINLADWYGMSLHHVKSWHVPGVMDKAFMCLESGTERIFWAYVFIDRRLSFMILWSLKRCIRKNLLPSANSVLLFVICSSSSDNIQSKKLFHSLHKLNARYVRSANTPRRARGKLRLLPIVVSGWVRSRPPFAHLAPTSHSNTAAVRDAISGMVTRNWSWKSFTMQWRIYLNIDLWQSWRLLGVSVESPPASDQSERRNLRFTFSCSLSF